MADKEQAELSLLTFDTLGRGVGKELFQAELDRVLENVLDPNTPPKAKRSIRLDVIVKPSEDRDECEVEIKVSSKIAAPRGASASIFVGRKRGRAVATTFDPRQMQLGWDEASRPAVIPPAAGEKATGS